MKRLLIIIALILISIFGYVVVANGFSNDGMNINISSYTQLGQKSEELTKDVAAYNKKNDEEYSSSLSKLNTAKKQYTLAKEEYQKKIDEYGNLLQADYNYLKNKYRIDFLQTRIGGYAAENGIGLTIVRSNSETPDPNAATWGYVLCNLNFMVSGEYINIANFLYDIENDEELDEFIKMLKESNIDSYELYTKGSANIEVISKIVSKLDSKAVIPIDYGEEIKSVKDINNLKFLEFNTGMKF